MQIHQVTPDEWRLWRDIRLTALASDPEEFGSTLAREREYGDAAPLERAGERPVLEQRDGTAAAVRLGDVEQRVLRATHRRGVIDEEDRRVAHRRAAS